MIDFTNFINQFPYMDTHELNLDWVLKAIKQLFAEMNDFEAANSVEYVGEWNIKDQYNRWSIVTTNNNAYLAVQAVPSNIPITDKTYWLNIGIFKVDQTLDINSIYPIANRAVALKFEDVNSVLNILRMDVTYAISKANDLEDALDLEIVDRKASINLETAERKASDNLINARIDEIIEGASVDPDAEILDIRVGYDGKTYDTAGDAVRGQVDDLHTEIDNFLSEESDSGNIFVFDRNDNIFKVVPDDDVIVGSKNILENTMAEGSHTVNGITYETNADGSITISGTASANTQIWINQTLAIPQGKYHLSGCPSGGSATTYRLQCNVTVDGIDQTFLIDSGSGNTNTLSADISRIRCYFIVFSGASVDFTIYPQLEYGETGSEYVSPENQSVSSGTVIEIDETKTVFSMDSFDIDIYKFKWVYDIQTFESIFNSRLEDVEEIVEEVDAISKECPPLFTDNLSYICVHHDNFSREETGWNIGMNARGTDVGNAYEWVTPENYNDGLTVDNGATFASGARTYNFSLRKIAEDHDKNFMVETNAPITDYKVGFAYNVTDINNFTYIECEKKTNGYGFIVREVKNNTFSDIKINKIVYKVLAKVLQIYVVNDWFMAYLDDELVLAQYLGDTGTELYLYAYKNANYHFDFVNVFNISKRVIWNPNHVIDTGVSSVPLITTSANEEGYELQNTLTRWSNYADHFTLHNNDTPISSGIRSERSIENIDIYKANLRNLKISFDVYCPSEYNDTEYPDVLMQMHDRDATAYRAFVPFLLDYFNRTFKVYVSSTHIPKAEPGDVTKWVNGETIADITPDKWHHVEIYIKERYDENQNPFIKIKLDDITIFECRKPNCYNDLQASSPQYGVYKNNWGTGITTFERYFDNFKIEY